MTEMHTSANGVAIIEAFESCLKKVGPDAYRTYHCPANVLTIGWGTTRSDVPDLKEGEVWTRAKCDAVFAGSLGRYEDGVRRLGPLSQNQFDALVSLAYNCGVGALDGSIGKAIKAGRMDDVPALLARWNKGGGKVLPGLVRRRKAEGELWSGKVATAFATAQAIMPQTMPQAVDLPKPSLIDTAKEVKGQAAATAGAAVVAVASAAVPVTPPQTAATVAVSAPSPAVSLPPVSVLVGSAAIVAAIIGAVLFWRAHKRLSVDWA